MKTFLSFISENAAKDKEKDDGFFIDKDGYAVPSEPITIKPPKKDKKKVVNEYTIKNLPGQHKFGDRSQEASDHATAISDKLHSAQKVKPNATQKRHLLHYTGGSYANEENGSYNINKKLIDNHKNGHEPTTGMKGMDKRVHETIAHLSNHPLGHDVHLYSGVGFNPKKAAQKSKNSIIHLPAHISTSHSTDIASDFASQKTGHHIIHIDAKAHHKGYHIGKYSDMDHEHETVIPAGTKLKYSHTTNHSTGNRFTGRVKLQVHHFTIHSQD
jgi:hypothetical protein